MASFLIITTEPLFPDTEKKGFFFFYPLKEDNTVDYFTRYYDLLNIEKDPSILNAELIELFFNDIIGKNFPESLLLESYLRYTKNKGVRKKIEGYIRKNNLSDNFSMSLLRLYNAKEEKTVDLGYPKLRYNYQNKYFDENINLFLQKEVSFFDDELTLVMFENEWRTVILNNDQFKKNNLNREVLNFIYGGDTNSFVFMVIRYTNITFKQFHEKAINDKFFTERHKNFTTVELKKEEFHEKCGADKIFISYGVGPDIIPNVESAMLCLHLYSYKLKKGYQVIYSMNFSESNNNYLLRERIWNQLLLQLCFTSINTNTNK